MAQQRGSDINASWVGDEGENISLQEEYVQMKLPLPGLFPITDCFHLQDTKGQSDLPESQI